MSFGRQNYLFAHRSDLFFASKIIRELGGQECFFPIFFAPLVVELSGVRDTVAKRVPLTCDKHLVSATFLSRS